jgi:nitrogenase iron protein NifH
MRQIALYGKGGIGKSTVASNLSAALAEVGYKVMQVGCDPKQDSTTTLVGQFLPTVLETLQTHNVSFDVNFGLNGQHAQLIDEFVFKGFCDVVCVEAGGPKPGVGCAGRGVLVALEFLSKHDVFGKYQIETVIYDVLGDVVCGGFAAPMRQGYAAEVYLITSGELMALYAANNIAKTIQRLANERKNARIGGIIHNQRNVLGEIELVEEFAERLGVPVMVHIPRSDDVQLAELQGKTVIEARPDSPQARVYRDLAQKIQANQQRIIPTPFETIGDLQFLMQKHQVAKLARRA